jgi:hypothetical protein
MNLVRYKCNQFSDNQNCSRAPSWYLSLAGDLGIRTGSHGLDEAHKLNAGLGPKFPQLLEGLLHE